MTIQKIRICLLFCFFTISAFSQSPEKMEVSMGNTDLQFMLNENGQPFYSVYFSKKPVILPSAMGFSLNDDSLFFRDFIFIGKEEKTFDETWQPVWGEVKDIRNHY